MSASQRVTRLLRVARNAALVVACLAAPRPGIAQSSADVIKTARSLERRGAAEEAERSIRDAMASDRELAAEAAVVIELARLTASADEIPGLLEKAVSRTRDPRLLASAHRSMGDYFFMAGRYLAAAREYDLASRYTPRSAPDEAALRRAASFLAAGDASKAASCYREVADRGGTPGELMPWAELGAARAALVSGDPATAAQGFGAVARAFQARDVRLTALTGLAESLSAAGDSSGARAAATTLETEYPGTFEAAVAREIMRSFAAEGAPPHVDSPDSAAAPDRTRE